MFNSDSFKVTVRDSNYEEAFAIEGHLIDVLNQNLKAFDVETYTLDQTHLESYEINSYTSRNVLIAGKKCAQITRLLNGMNIISMS